MTPRPGAATRFRWLLGAMPHQVRDGTPVIDPDFDNCNDEPLTGECLDHLNRTIHHANRTGQA